MVFYSFQVMAEGPLTSILGMCILLKKGWMWSLNAICTTLQGMDVVSQCYMHHFSRDGQSSKCYMHHSSRDGRGLLVLYASLSKRWTQSSKCYMHHSSRDKHGLSSAICTTLSLQGNSLTLRGMNIVSLIQQQHHSITSLQWGALMPCQNKIKITTLQWGGF